MFVLVSSSLFDISVSLTCVLQSVEFGQPLSARSALTGMHSLLSQYHNVIARGYCLVWCCVFSVCSPCVRSCSRVADRACLRQRGNFARRFCNYKLAMYRCVSGCNGALLLLVVVVFLPFVLFCPVALMHCSRLKCVSQAVEVVSFVMQPLRRAVTSRQLRSGADQCCALFPVRFLCCNRCDRRVQRVGVWRLS